MGSSTLLGTLVVALALLTSCGVPSGDSPDSTIRSPSSTTLQPTVQAHPRSGAYDLVLEDVRVAAHGGGDRVVLRFAGTGGPGWAARYVDEAVVDGSGETVELDGDAILQLDVSGTPTPDPGGSGPVPQELGGRVVDLHVVGVFEGVTQVFVGLDGGRAPFRVFTRTAPPRLVVDVG